jgi:hypothetical protein
VRIGMVGGVERSETTYREIAERFGHELIFHGGHVGGRGSATLAELARRVDLLIVVTDVNSHGAVQLARRAARKSGIPTVLQRRCSVSRFAELLAGLSAPEARAAPIPL